jgi:uncharacterized membrane protein SirB2
VISYEIYKFIHLLSLFFLFTGLSVAFFSANQIKFFKIMNGVSSLLVMVSGMGLMARLGIKHGEPWPQWIFIKFGVWFILAVGGAIVAKRFPKVGPKAYVLMMILLSLAVYAVIMKF